jgi:hypothetical protein
LKNLEITCARSHSGEGYCVVEYVGGRIELFDVDHYPIKQLPERLEHREG